MLYRRIRTLMLVLITLAQMSLVACSRDVVVAPDGDDTDDDPITTTLEIPDWMPDTHGNDAAPNYDEVFAEGEVKRIDIVISADDWQAMLDDMTSRYGAFGTRSGRPPAMSGNPIWVAASVFYDEIEWYKVGVRFKGNSSLATSWSRSNMKLPLKLDFDEFEDTYTQLDDQRFYGFKQLSLSSGYDDKSLIREKVVADIFRDAGLCSARSTFCRVYIDHGDGAEYFGLYTMLEVIDDTAVDAQFADGSGNLYKPDGQGASFKNGTYSTQWFPKESNEIAADWSDISALFDVLHAGTRTSDPAQWRTDLESVLDVDVFLLWLATNTVIQNWDTYGVMTHNYYLYNNPQTGLLNWVPWDNNEALKEGKMGGAIPLGFASVNSSDWPLIGYIYADATYRTRFDELVQSTVDNVFNSARMVPVYQSASALVSPYVVGVDGERSGFSSLENESDFATALTELISHVSAREATTNNYLTK